MLLYVCLSLCCLLSCGNAATDELRGIRASGNALVNHRNVTVKIKVTANTHHIIT